jgi:hypothetical protein
MEMECREYGTRNATSPALHIKEIGKDTDCIAVADIFQRYSIQHYRNQYQYQQFNYF